MGVRVCVYIRDHILRTGRGPKTLPETFLIVRKNSECDRSSCLHWRSVPEIVLFVDFQDNSLLHPENNFVWYLTPPPKVTQGPNGKICMFQINFLVEVRRLRKDKVKEGEDEG